MSSARSRSALHAAIGALITGVLAYALFAEEGINELWEIALGIDRTALGLYVLCSLLGILVRAVRYDNVLAYIVEGRSRPSIVHLALMTGIRNAFVDFLPARAGELSVFYVLKRYGVDIISTVSTLGLSIALDVVVLAGIGVVLMLVSFIPNSSAIFDPELVNRIFGSSRYSVAIVLFLMVAVFVLFAAKIGGLCRFFASALNHLGSLNFVSRHRWLRGLLDFALSTLGRLGQDLDAVKDSGVYGRLIFLTIVLRVLKYGSLYLLLVGVLSGMNIVWYEVSPLVAFVAFLSAEAATSLPISGIMGFGAYELSWTAVFSLSGLQIPGDQLMRIVFVIHVISQILAYSVGLLCLLHFTLRELQNKPA